ncbi:MAG: hypothetical protein K6F55_04300 [Eubacterium sp.]|nr:hypothetical protein [Eubacterium sp.]
MEKEIQLINDIIAMAIIHGGDLGGPYEINTEGLVSSINRWLEEKDLKDDFHVISKLYEYTLNHSYYTDIKRPEETKITKAIKGRWPVLQIAPIDEMGEDYSDIYIGDIDSIE